MQYLFSHLLAFLATCGAVIALNSRSLFERSEGQVTYACWSPELQLCNCPLDNDNETGVLINYYPGYQCAYAGGACTWTDTGVLQNTAQTNCPTLAPCNATGCGCITDLNGDAGVLINEFTGFQCAYAGGACTWDLEGDLQNIAQANCPTTASCDSTAASCASA